MKNIQQTSSRGIYLNAFGVIAIIGILTLALWPKSVNVTIEKDCPDGKVVTEKTQALKQASAKLSDAKGQVARLSSLVETEDNNSFSQVTNTTKDSYKGKTIAGLNVPQVQDYAKRWLKVAKVEKQKYGIPISITLAQGILESKCGRSRLAQNGNNHFGMKCFAKKCKKGHCGNYSDDSHKDFFRHYETAWESWRAHSQLLQKDRYDNCRKCGSSNYKCWAINLKKAGYATHKNYDKLLVNIIENEYLNLYLYDVDN